MFSTALLPSISSPHECSCAGTRTLQTGTVLVTAFPGVLRREWCSPPSVSPPRLLFSDLDCIVGFINKVLGIGAFVRLCARFASKSVCVLIAMALIQHRLCGVSCWSQQQLKLGLPWSGASSLQCGRQRVVAVSGKAVRSEMQTESAVADNGAYTMPVFPGSSNSPEHIGYGMLDEQNFYRERFVVRFSEVGDRGTMSLEMLSSLLQEAACNHVLKIGYGAFAGTNERLVTVTTRMHIEVDRYPRWRDLLEVDTWYCTEGRNAVRRDWTLKDVNTGETIAIATSTWVIMNMDTKVIQRITDSVRSEFAPWAREPPKWALSEERIKASSGRIPKINGDAEFQTSGLSPSERDLDMNQHVNNVKYISWTMESLPKEFREIHEIRKITLEYRREVQKGDTLESRAKTELCKDNGASVAGSTEEPIGERFIHVIRNQDGQEINKGRTVWARSRK